MRADGGGKVIAFPIVGIERVLRLFPGLARKQAGSPATFLRAVRVDRLPGLVGRERGGMLHVTALNIRDGRIAGISITRNPDKLRPVAEAIALPAAAPAR